MPVPVEHTPSGAWLVHDPHYKTHTPTTHTQSRTIAYARVSTPSQKDDLQRQSDRLKAFAINLGVESPQVITEIASGINENRRINQILQDPTITTIIVEHRDRLARINFKLIESTLKAQGRHIIVIDDNEIEDDLIRDMTEVLTSYCARFYGRRAAKNKAKRAMEAIQDD